LCDPDIATYFGVVAEKLILVDSCAVFVIYFIIKKKVGTIQNEICGGIRL